MAVNLATGFIRQVSEPVDARYLNAGATYVDVEAANEANPSLIRHIGQFVNIGNELYWYKDGTADEDLVPFSSGGGGEFESLSNKVDEIVPASITEGAYPTTEAVVVYVESVTNGINMPHYTTLDEMDGEVRFDKNYIYGSDDDPQDISTTLPTINDNGHVFGYSCLIFASGTEPEWEESWKLTTASSPWDESKVNRVLVIDMLTSLDVTIWQQQ